MNNLTSELSREGFNLSSATRKDLPPASLQRFLRAGVQDNFEGYVLADFNEEFNNEWGNHEFSKFHVINNVSWQVLW